jgi:cardiolipin synthase A/B
MSPFDPMWPVMHASHFSFLLFGALACVTGCSSANGGGIPNAGGSTASGGASTGGSGSGLGGSGAVGPGGQPGSGGTSTTGGSSGTGGTSATGGTGGTPSGSGGTKGGTGGSSTGGSLSGVSIIVEPNGNKGSELTNAILGATSSVHMTMYLLSSTEVINALISQHHAGLQVEVLLDPSPSGTSNQSVYSQLSSAGVAVHWGSSKFTYTHEKCVILDKKEAWIMTMNATYSAPIDNREYLAIDDNATDVAEAESIFEGDFAGNPPSSVSGPLVVAPINATSTIVSLIQSAKKTIDIEGEEFSDYHTADALSAAGHVGVQIHIVLANTSASSSQTTAVNQVKAAGAKVVKLATPYMHAKSLVVDGTTAFIGSENFSTGSLEYNRELGVVFTTPSEVAKVLNTTNSDFAAGTPE